jgi:DNA-binding CsgD family transcriptional regulator
MGSANHHALLTLVDRLYAAALDASVWNDFLVSAAGMFEADHAFIGLIDHRRRTLDYVGLPQARRDAMPVARYAKLLDDDPRRPMFDGGLGQAIHCGMGLSRSRLCASRTYRDYLKPLDIEYAMVAQVPVREGVTHGIGLTRSALRPPFGADGRDLLNELVPHLSRALEISRALGESKAARKAPLPGPSAPTSPVPEQKQLQLMLALTPAQARLAALIFGGNSVREAAGELGITEASARQYLKRIFARTGARRQGELIRMIGERMMRAG